MSLALEYAVRSEVGLVRDRNEDAVFASSRMVAVADGVGGHAAGEIASRLVVDQLALLDKCHLREPLTAAVAGAIDAGNDAISFVASCRPALAGMGTTLTALAIDDGYLVANIGDSRTYLYRDGALLQLTRDDSFVQELIDAGQLDPGSARRHPRRSLVLQALDGTRGRAPKLSTCRARRGDRLLLCSDGLTDFVEVNSIRDALSLPSRTDACDSLVAQALAAGGRDNVSVIVADAIWQSD